ADAARPTSGQQALGRKLLATVAAAAIENRAAVLGGHTGTETVTTGTHELAGLVCTLHNIRPRCRAVPLSSTACAEMTVGVGKWSNLPVGGVYRRKRDASQRGSL